MARRADTEQDRDLLRLLRLEQGRRRRRRRPSTNSDENGKADSCYFNGPLDRFQEMGPNLTWLLCPALEIYVEFPLKSKSEELCLMCGLLPSKICFFNLIKSLTM